MSSGTDTESDEDITAPAEGSSKKKEKEDDNEDSDEIKGKEDDGDKGKYKEGGSDDDEDKEEDEADNRDHDNGRERDDDHDDDHDDDDQHDAESSQSSEKDRKTESKKEQSSSSSAVAKAPSENDDDSSPATGIAEHDEEEEGEEEEDGKESPSEPSSPQDNNSTHDGGEWGDKDVRSHVLPKDFEPNALHVLCGRRKGHKDFGGNWPGNLALESLIIAHLPEYEAVEKIPAQKIALINKVLAIVRDRGGRFVRRAILQDDHKNPQQRWMEVGDLNAKKDIHAIFKVFFKARQSQMQVNTAAAAAASRHSTYNMAPVPGPPPPRPPQPPQPPQPPPQGLPKLPPPPKTAQYFQSRGMSQAEARQAAAMATTKYTADVAAAKHAAKLAKKHADDVAATQRASDEKQAAALAATKQAAASAAAKQALTAFAAKQAESSGNGTKHVAQRQSLPTRLYKVEDSSASRRESESSRKRQSFQSENYYYNTEEPERQLQPSERMQKRRSVDEDMAVDALQLIAQAAAATTAATSTATGDDSWRRRSSVQVKLPQQETTDDDPTTHSAPTVRRRSSVQVKLPARQATPQDRMDVSRSELLCCCLQLAPRGTRETPWDATQRALACLTSVALQERGVDLFVLPELCPIGSSQDTFTKFLPLSTEWQNLYHKIDKAFSDQARELGVYIVYGTIGWQRRDTDRSLKFTLQHKVVNREGSVVAVYDKAYLSDLEFRFFEAGPRTTAVFQLDGFNFGLLVGDDLKYPNLARSLTRDRDADVLVHPSADPTPRYFRQCRAVENCVYVLGAEYTNGATVAVPPDPDHEPIGIEEEGEGEEGYLLTRVQRAATEFARTHFPYYRHMKTEHKGEF